MTRKSDKLANKFIMLAVISACLIALALAYGFVVRKSAVSDDDKPSAATGFRASIDNKAHSPYANISDPAALNQAYRKIAKDLSDQDKKHLAALYKTHDTSSFIRLVRDDVASAAKLCKQANPDMEQTLDQSLTDWNASSNAALSEAKAQSDNMIITQDYIDIVDIKALLASSTQIREASEAALKKQPDTSKASCEFLLSKMHTNKDVLSQALRNTLTTLQKLVASADKSF